MKKALPILVLLATWAAADATAQVHVQGSFFPYYEFTRNVVGSTSTVDQFLPLGIGVHDWEPSISLVQTLEDTDVFVYNGLGIEAYPDQLIDQGFDTVFVDATSGLNIEHDDIITTISEILAKTDKDSAQTIKSISDAMRHYDIEYIVDRQEDGTYTVSEALQRIHNWGPGILVRDDESSTIAEIRSVLQSQVAPDVQISVLYDVLDIEEYEAMEDEHMHEEDEHMHEEDEHMHEEDEHMQDDGHDHHHHDHGGIDPHVWLDPILAIQQSLTIRDALVEVDPENAYIYNIHAANYIAELLQLHENYNDRLSSCQKDTIVTFHGAFAYMVEQYDINIVSLAGLSNIEDVSIRTVTELIEFINANDINYVLSENIVDTRAIDVVAEETGATVLILSPIEGISEQDFNGGATYVSIMYENLDSLETALECQ